MRKILTHNKHRDMVVLLLLLMMMMMMMMMMDTGPKKANPERWFNQEGFVGRVSDILVSPADGCDVGRLEHPTTKVDGSEAMA